MFNKYKELKCRMGNSPQEVVAEVEAETLINTVAEVEVEEIVDTLAYTVAELRPETLSKHYPI